MQNAGIVRNRLKITSTINNAQKFLAVQEQFGSQGLQPIPTSPEAFGKRLREEIRKWGPVVKASGAKPE